MKPKTQKSSGEEIDLRPKFRNLCYPRQSLVDHHLQQPKWRHHKVNKRQTTTQSRRELPPVRPPNYKCQQRKKNKNNPIWERKRTIIRIKLKPPIAAGANGLDKATVTSWNSYTKSIVARGTKEPPWWNQANQICEQDIRPKESENDSKSKIDSPKANLLNWSERRLPRTLHIETPTPQLHWYLTNGDRATYGRLRLHICKTNKLNQAKGPTSALKEPLRIGHDETTTVAAGQKSQRKR